MLIGLLKQGMQKEQTVLNGFMIGDPRTLLLGADTRYQPPEAGDVEREGAAAAVDVDVAADTPAHLQDSVTTQ